jgi:hypothetical protein
MPADSAGTADTRARKRPEKSSSTQTGTSGPLPLVYQSYSRFGEPRLDPSGNLSPPAPQPSPKTHADRRRRRRPDRLQKPRPKQGGRPPPASPENASVDLASPNVRPRPPTPPRTLTGIADTWEEDVSPTGQRNGRRSPVTKVPGISRSARPDGGRSGRGKLSGNLSAKTPRPIARENGLGRSDGRTDD